MLNKIVGKTTHFKITLTAPLHIGCGTVYDPTGFVIDFGKKELIAFQAINFLSQLDAATLQAYSNICQKGTVTSIQELYKFMNRHKEVASGNQIAISKGLAKHFETVLKKSATDFEKELSQFVIDRTSFDPLTDQPIIPGSSLKGSLRTAILNQRNANDPPEYKSKSDKELQAKLLGGSFGEDPFRLIKVSDFTTVGEAKRKILYAIAKWKNPAKKNQVGQYQVLEVVEAGTVFAGSITIFPPSPQQIKSPIKLGEINQALIDFFSSEKQREEQQLSKIDLPAIDDSQIQGVPLRLGRHSGAECTTIEGHRKIKVSAPKVGIKIFKDTATTIWLASNSKNPNDNRSLLPFGWAKMTSIEENEAVEIKKKQQEWLVAFQKKLQVEKVRRETADRKRKLAVEQAKLEQREEEEENRKFPWKKLLRDSQAERIEDWGDLSNRLLNGEELKNYQDSPQLAEEIKKVARRVQERYPRKWSPERDEEVKEWLVVSGVSWESQNVAASVPVPQLQDELTSRIEAISNLGEYLQNPVALKEITLPSAKALEKKFREWGCDKKKAKPKKQNIWKELQNKLTKLKSQSR
jgi:CRISPR-associated protein Csm5